MKWIAKTLTGLESVLAEELESLGATEVEPITRAVAFEATNKVMFRANLESRLALKIMKPLFEYTALNIDEYYNELYRYPWPKEFGNAKTFIVQVTTSSQVFYHSKFMILKTKDAIVDHFRRHLGFRPNIDKDDPDIRIEVHIRKNHVSVYLDTTGKSLHYRGYRTEKHPAPLSEVLAAGMIKLSGWDMKTPFYDGMCGSGTLLTEAAWMAMNYPPGLNRTEFAFMRLPRFKKMEWEQTVRQAKARIKPLEVEMHGSDVEGYAIKITGRHLNNAGVEGVTLKKTNFFHLEPKPPIHLMLNPPYGERLTHQDIHEFYAQIGTHLKHNLGGAKVWIISSELSAMQHIGLRPFRKFNLLNGALECKFQGYELFEGKLKTYKAENAANDQEE